MTKIDESKQYKFSEIIAMLEKKELPTETVIRRENKMYSDRVLKVESNIVGEVGVLSPSEKVSIRANIALLDINSFWSIKLPKEDKFYLKAPDCFIGELFLTYHKTLKKYYTSNKFEDHITQTQFTQKEIDAMPFDTNFFGDPISVEQTEW
ncbi:hypothetical protein [Carnobacterium maltaromaticum]|uniref:hypothetical protein n=1 Tax=Carnobacterium maltaromaticum TaxID=2751 RepID=UPI0039B07706